MSLVFSHSVTNDSIVTDVPCEIHCDWLAFSIIDYDFNGTVSDPIFASVPSVTMKENLGHHQYTFMSDGFRLAYLAKPGCKNYDLELQLKGKFFVANDLSELLHCINSRGGKILVSRCDAALDYYGHIDLRKPVISHKGKGTQFADLEDYWSGYKYGVSERVVRLYDKAKQSDDYSHGSWFRYEIVMRGDKARDVFGYEFKQITANDIDNRCADILSCRNNSCYDEYFTEIAAKISTGKIVATKKAAPEYQNSEDYLFATLQRKIDNFKRKWKKQIPADFESKLANFLHLTLSEEKTEKNPPTLIGGSSIPNNQTNKSTESAVDAAQVTESMTWDELMQKMDEQEKNNSEINSKIIDHRKILIGLDQKYNNGEKTNVFNEMRSSECVEQNQQSWQTVQFGDTGSPWLPENEFVSG